MAQKYATNKKSTMLFNLAEILAILPTHGLIILTKFDENCTKIVDFLLLAYFLASVISFESIFISLTYLFNPT